MLQAFGIHTTIECVGKENHMFSELFVRASRSKTLYCEFVSAGSQ